MASTKPRHVVITGGSSGIGAAAAAVFKQDGARVTIIDRQAPADADNKWIEADLTDLGALAQIRPQGQIDVLVNAAGLPPRAGLESAILAVNTVALITLTEQMLGQMPKGSSIVNLASIAGGKWRDNMGQVLRLLDLPKQGDLDGFVRAEGLDPVRAYDLSKEAVIVWGMKSVGQLRDLGIRVNSVSPGPIDTPILGDFMAAFGERGARAVHLTKRAGTADEVARLVRFLASPDASWLSGLDVACDGGLVAQRTYEAMLDAS